MTGIIQNITQNIQEAEEDLFPGFDSTAFDEHFASKTATPSVNSISQRIERIRLAGKNNRQLANEIYRKVKYGHTWQSYSSPVEALKDQPWISKYPIAEKRLNSITVDTSPSKHKKLERMIASYESSMASHFRHEATIKKLKSKLLRVRKHESEGSIKNKAASTPHKQIDVNTMPHYFKVSYRTWHLGNLTTGVYSNPYFLPGAGHTAFADHPAHFTEWTGHLRTMYFELTRLIDKLGLPELDTMYASGTLGNDLKYYLTNKDDSVIVTNQRTKPNMIEKISIFIQDQKRSGDYTRFWTKRITAPFMTQIYKDLA